MCHGLHRAVVWVIRGVTCRLRVLADFFLSFTAGHLCILKHIFHLYAIATNNRRREALCFRLVRPSVRCPLALISRYALRSVGLLSGGIFNGTWHKFSSYESALLKRLPRSKVKGQGHSETKCIFAAEAYISTMWRRGWLVMQMSQLVTRLLCKEK